MWRLSARGDGGQAGPLSGLSVVDLSTTMPGALATQFLAEAGADVVLVEPPGGGSLRATAAWPAVGGGKRAAVLDIHDDGDRATLRAMLRTADVAVTTLRPRTAGRLGLAPPDLVTLNPRLVAAAITGWGSSGPWADLKGYEGLVMAKLGMFHAKQAMVARPGPAFVSVPFATWGAAQTAVHGILAALLEREASGRGQYVEADLVRGAGMFDTWAWFEKLVEIRWPDAFAPAAATDQKGDPRGALMFALLVAPTKDGHWLQFAQIDPRLFAAMMEEFGLYAVLAQPRFKDFPRLETPAAFDELWDYMLTKVGERTLAEWQHVFDTNPNINAEVFRSGPGVLDHPQLRHDGRVVVVEDPERGPVRRPSTLVHAGGRPLSPPRPAPRLDEHGDQVRAAATGAFDGAARVRATFAAGPDAPAGLPLSGVTVLEFGVQFAAPFGSTMLTDLGARVLKVESLGGDTIRTLAAFPEAAGARVMQGKESIALDLTTDEGRRVVHELVRRVDVVLVGFRAGAAERVGLDEKTLLDLNRDLVYVNAPGYGTGGPSGHRPAYAPSIGAAIGLALTEAPNATSATGSLREVKSAAARLFPASAVPSLQADGISALGVASGILLGLLARARGRALEPITLTMLGTGSHALLDRVVDYAGRPPSPQVDADGLGFGALYRMYRTAEGWLFLATPAEREWRDLVSVLTGPASLDGSAAAAAAELTDAGRFGSAAARRAHDAELAAALEKIFATRTAAAWERLLTATDVGCVRVTEIPPEVQMQTDPLLAAEYATTAVSPVFDEHLRVAPPVRFSRSSTQAKGGCLAGDHTDAVLHEIGYSDDRITDLRKRRVVK